MKKVHIEREGESMFIYAEEGRDELKDALCNAGLRAISSIYLWNKNNGQIWLSIRLNPLAEEEDIKDVENRITRFMDGEKETLEIGIGGGYPIELTV